MKSVEDTTIAEFSFDDNRQRGEAGGRELPQRAYLLRCWRERRAMATREPVWRFSVEEVFDERRRRGFSSLEALVAFIRAGLTGDEETLSDEEGGSNA